MVTIDNIHMYRSSFSFSRISDKNLASDALVSDHLSMSRKHRDSGNKPMSEYLDIPGLISDSENVSDDEAGSEKSSEGSDSNNDEEQEYPSLDSEMKSEVKSENTEDESSKEEQNKTESITETALTAEQFKRERLQLMSVIIKYVSAKITNSFPPELPSELTTNELPLETFLLILVSRLHLSLPMFMKGIIYLFRYMDIIYLLRYLNQSNNFANYNEMDFPLKKLIVGCFKLALTRERVSRNWSLVSGLSNSEINSVVRTIVSRMNGKLTIKDIELLKLKSEIFRYVKMVTTTI